MMRRARLFRDERGAAAIEFALILPLLAGLVLFGVDGWLQINQVSQMRSAVQAGERYYEGGGADDTAAATLAMQSWAHAPGDGLVTAVRSCTCGGAAASCTTQCANNTLPNVYITLTSSGTYTGLMHSQSLTQSGGVRVR